MPTRNGTYLDSDGNRWEAMPFPDALDIVMWLAESAYHVDAEHHAWLARNEPGIQDYSDLRRLKEAITTVGEFIKANRDNLATLKTPRLGTGWPPFIYADVPSLKPTLPLDAIRICLAAASMETMDPEDIDRLRLQYGSDIQKRALDMVQSLIGLHGAVVARWSNPETAFSNCRLPPLQPRVPA